MASYLDQPSVRNKLGVDPAVTGNYSSCSNPVGQAFSLAMDEYHPTYPHVAALLERGVRALIYVGSYDWICNWLGNQAWTLNMEWSGKEAFGQQPLESWLIDGKVAGKTRSANGLTFATVDGAGHMVSLKLTFNFIAMPTQSDRSRLTNPKKRSLWCSVGWLGVVCRYSYGYSCSPTKIGSRCDFIEL